MKHLTYISYINNAIGGNMDEEYSETGRPLYVGEKKRPENAPPMRSAREAMTDPRNEAKKCRINGVKGR